VQPNQKYDRDFTAQYRAVLNIMVALGILLPPTNTAAPPGGQIEADDDEHSENGSEARTIRDRQRSPM
jgi:hypothetical protein